MKFLCNETRENLSAFLDGELNANEYEIVKKHIGECELCANEYKALCALSNELHALDAKPLPSDFNHKLHLRLMNEKKPKSGLFLPRNIRAYSAIAAGILLFILVRSGVYDNLNKSTTAYIDDAVLQYETESMDNSESKGADETSEGGIAQPQPSADVGRIANRDNSKNITAKQDNNTSQKIMAGSQTEGFEEPRQSLPVLPTPAPVSSDAQAAVFAPSENNDNSVTPSPETENIGENVLEDVSVFTEKSADSSEQISPPEPTSPADTAPALRFAPPVPTATPAPQPTVSGGGSTVASPPAPFKASSHDTEVAGFVSVTVRVNSFDEVASVLKEKYNAKEQENGVYIELDSEKFKEVMDFLLGYGAIVTQDETEEELTVNKCVVIPMN
ncbi:MAG: hypothetical protein BWY15_01239 [Firmicutes bacterium ADurb.Bin193]|nr:MAG: hypothetical protein BWY15_01239 [Firmicutes bacterium ADurb.Bin193]